jgi:hypothetical protein
MLKFILVAAKAAIARPVAIFGAFVEKGESFLKKSKPERTSLIRKTSAAR